MLNLTKLNIYMLSSITDVICMLYCDELLITLAAIEDIFTQCDLKM